MLHFINFHKYYGSQHVLQIDNLVIEPGIYWIKGVNGSGKSTLLKTVAGILSFNGDIILNKHINLKKQITGYRKVVNFAEAEPIFPAFLTGQELIRLFASAKNASLAQEQYFTEQLNVLPYMHQPLGTYSSGMLKKLSLVLSFLGNPALILLDEPLNTLDTHSVEILYKLISHKYTQEGTSFLLSSHQALDAAALPLAKRITVVKQTLQLET